MSNNQAAQRDNPHVKTKRKVVVVAAPRKPKPRHGSAQQQFTTDARKRIDDDPLFFQKHGWANIAYGFSRSATLASKKKIDVESFCVKPIAAWVPHRLIPECIPSCPNCKSKNSVDVNITKWVEHPKILCGCGTHRHFDTKCCWCSHCCGSFAA